MTATLSLIGGMLLENGYLRRPLGTFFGQTGHKEWLHFTVHAPGLDLLVNFSVVDDIRRQTRAGKEIPRITCLVRESDWGGDIDQYAPGDVSMSGGQLAARFGENQVSFDGEAFSLRVKLRRRPVSMELRLVPLVFATPAHNLMVDDCPPINWLVVPRLCASGTVQIGEREHIISDAVAYHDHNWGFFRWGKDFAWEWGYAAPSDASRDWTLVFVRLTDRAHNKDLMQAVFMWKGPRQRRVFRDAELNVWHTGLLRSDKPFKLPRVMGLVSQGSATDVPAALHVEARGQDDWARLEFHSRDVAQVIIPNDDDFGVTIINEVSGVVSVEAEVGGEHVAFSCPSIFEFLSD